MGNTDTTQSDWRLCRAAGFLNYAPVGSSGGKLKTVGDGLCRTNTEVQVVICRSIPDSARNTVLNPSFLMDLKL